MGIKKTVFVILLLVSILVLVFRFGNQLATSVFKIDQKAGVRILSTPSGAKVFIDSKEVGKTPFEEQNLSNKEYLIKIESDEGSWQGSIKLNGGTLSVVNRELSKDMASAAGEVLTLERGSGTTVISTPEASVEIDGKDYGTTPVSVSIKPGEHTFALKRGNYLNRSIRATVPDNFNLTLNVDLALSEADLTNIATPVITETPKVVVKTTPTGFLRVREKADTTSKEITKVSPGDELTLLEELSGWYRVRLPSGTEGYVSTSYVEKKPLSP